MAIERTSPDYVICRGELVPVLRVIAHPPGTHPSSPIVNDVTAIETVTPNGSRWHGTRRAWIGGDLRMHWEAWS